MSLPWAGCRSPLVLAALACVAALALPSAVLACAACGNPTLPQSPTGSGTLPSGTVNISVSAQTTVVNVSHPAGCQDLADCPVVPVQEEHTHELLVVPLEVTPAISWAVRDRVALELEAPLRMVALRADYETPDGDPFSPIDAGVHHRDETLFGLADMRLGVRTALQVGTWWLNVRPGLTLPTGRTEEDPFALGEQGLRHQHVQFGNGTFDPTLGIDVTRGTARGQFSFYGTSQVSLYENRHGFRAGPRVLVGAAAGVKTARAIFSLLLEGSSEGAQRWSGEIQEDGLVGRKEIGGGARVIWFLGETTLSATVRLPFYRWIEAREGEPGELRAPASLQISAAWTLGG